MPPRGFRRVYQAGTPDVNGRFMGGTEIMHLVAHAGRLYAATSTLWDQPGDDPAVGAQVLVLERPDAGWRVEYEFAARHWRMSLVSVTFTVDGRGRALPAPVSMLLAAPSDGQGHATIHARDEASGVWTEMSLARSSGRASSVRCVGMHRDRVTGIERVFAGTLPGGLYSGVYDADVPGRIRWSESPELSGYKARPMAFAECDGALHVAIKPHLYRLVDGEQPRWETVYTLPGEVTRISSGLRGLTTIAHPSGHGESLLAALEGENARIVRIDPSDGYRETVDLDVLEFLGQQGGRRPGYAIVAYDDMTPVPLPGQRGTALLMGLEATHSTEHATHPKEGWEPEGRYLIRHPDGRYELRRIIDPTLDPMPPLVSTRTIRVSPFDGETIYFGGYDPNSVPAHNTGWVFSAPLEIVLSGG